MNVLFYNNLISTVNYKKKPLRKTLVGKLLKNMRAFYSHLKKFKIKKQDYVKGKAQKVDQLI